MTFLDMISSLSKKMCLKDRATPTRVKNRCEYLPAFASPSMQSFFAPVPVFEHDYSSVVTNDIL